MVGRLDIQTTRAVIDMTSRQARIDLRQPQPGYEMTRQRGGIDIETEHPKLEIDDSVCRAEEGNENAFQFIADTARQAIQDIQQGCTEHAQQGWYILKNFHTSKNVIAEMAYNKAVPPMRESVLKFIPSEPPKINFTDNIFDMDVRPDQIDFQWNVSPQADIEEAQKASLDIHLAQYPSIVFTYIPPPQLDTTA